MRKCKTTILIAENGDIKRAQKIAKKLYEKHGITATIEIGKAFKERY